MPIRALAETVPDALCSFLDGQATPRGERHWRWKYERTPSPLPAGFYWEEADGAVLGFIGMMGSALYGGGAAHPAAWFVDWHVTQGDRGVGVGVGLLRKAEAAAGVLLTLQGSEDTRQILPRLRWRQSLLPTTWVRPLSARYWSEWATQRLPSVLGPLAGAFAGIAATLRRPRAAAPPAGAALVAVDRLPAEYDAVWTARAAEFAPILLRDSAYLNWLCADYPDGGYRLHLLDWRGGVAGHLILRLDRDRRDRCRGRIVDLLWPRAEAALAAWMVAAAVVELQRAGADYVECVLSRPELAAAARACGFVRRRPVPLWYHRLPAGMDGADDWYITFLDCDRAYR